MRSTGEAIEALWRPEIARMHIPSLGRPEAELLAALAAASGARRALELGTAIGYSAAYIATGMGTNGHVDAVELNPSRAAVARQLWARAGLSGQIELHEGDALALTPTLGSGFDLVFVDLFWELGREEAGRQLGREVIAALRPGGTLVADNCDEGLPSAEGFLAEVEAAAFRTRAVLPLHDGVLVAVKA